MTRLYYPNNLFESATIALADDHVHYLRNVLRQEVGAPINLFNAKDGEWTGQIVTLTKSRGEVVLGVCCTPPRTEPQLTLLFCPIKQDQMHYLIEKCTEIGVTVFQPIIMERGNIHKINQEKLQRIAVEASQQCERLSIPQVLPLQQLRQAIQDWPAGHVLGVCAERHPGQGADSDSKVTAVLIGPEGGIHPEELQLLASKPFVQFMSLGKNILRAETAAVVAAAKILIPCSHI